MSTLVYAPAVTALIDTRSRGVIDVSRDISAGRITRVVNGVSSAQLTLLNQGGKYDGVFDDMDRIVIYLRRFHKLLVFSGYLDIVPNFTVYAQSVTIQASCTLKKLQNFLWDPGTRESVALLKPTGSQTDLALSELIVKLLTQVAGWEKTAIHLGQVPPQWFKQLSALAARVSTEAAQNMQGRASAQVGSSPVTFGSAHLTDFAPHGDGPGTGVLPATVGLASYADLTSSMLQRFGGLRPPYNSVDNTVTGSLPLTGENPMNGSSMIDQWYVGMRWPYARLIGTYPHASVQIIPGADVPRIQKWWANRGILIKSHANGKMAVGRAADWGPGVSERIMDMSPWLAQYLGVEGQGTMIEVGFAPPGLKPGPVTQKELSIAQQIKSPAEAKAARSVGKTVGSVVRSVTSDVTNAIDAVTGGGSKKTAKGAGSGKQLTEGQRIIAFAQQQLGKPYVWAASGPDSFDCSGLVQYVFGHFGIQATKPTFNQATLGTSIPLSQAQAGDIVLFKNVDPSQLGWDHVGICMGNGMMIAAPHTGVNVQEQKISDMGVGGDQIMVRRILKDPGGIAQPVGATTSGGAGGAGGGGGGSGSPANDVARSLFNLWSYTGQEDPLSDSLGGMKALMNDEPIFSTVGTLLQSGMRHFCSAPNGDFIGWFPDFFGHYGTAAVLTVEPIEIRQGFGVAKSDVSLKTHVFVTSQGAAGPSGTGWSPQEQTAMLQTAGVATVEMPELMQAIFGVKPTAENGLDARTILLKYGPRVDWQPMSNISGHSQEFYFAVMNFAYNWAQRFSSQIPLTFMPEAWPGMLVQIPKYQFQAYVQEVTHTFSLQEGGGFSTDLTVVAPASLGVTPLGDLPMAGPTSGWARE